MKLDYTPPGWDAPLSEVIADLRTSIETIRELDSFLPLGTELGRELDNIAARVTNLVDVFALVAPIEDCVKAIYSRGCSCMFAPCAHDEARQVAAQQVRELQEP